MAVDRNANNLSALRHILLRTRSRGTRIWTDYFERPEEFKMYTNFATWTLVFLEGWWVLWETVASELEAQRTEITNLACNGGPGFEGLQLEASGSSATSANLKTYLHTIKYSFVDTKMITTGWRRRGFLYVIKFHRSWKNTAAVYSGRNSVMCQRNTVR